MVKARLVPYDDEIHRDQLYELFMEYGTWVKKELFTRYGINYERVLGGTLQELLENIFPRFTGLKPPEGIIYILEVGDEAAGMGRISMLEEGVGEINNVYIRPRYWGKGFGRELLNRLEESAREFGFSILRLDTGDHNVAAQHLFRKMGFKEIEYYGSGARVARIDTEDGRKYYDMKIYMEKKL